MNYLSEYLKKDDYIRSKITLPERKKLRKQWNKTTGISWEDFLKNTIIKNES